MISEENKASVLQDEKLGLQVQNHSRLETVSRSVSGYTSVGAGTTYAFMSNVYERAADDDSATVTSSCSLFGHKQALSQLPNGTRVLSVIWQVCPDAPLLWISDPPSCRSQAGAPT